MVKAMCSTLRLDRQHCRWLESATFSRSSWLRLRWPTWGRARPSPEVARCGRLRCAGRSGQQRPHLEVEVSAHHGLVAVPEPDPAHAEEWTVRRCGQSNRAISIGHVEDPVAPVAPEKELRPLHLGEIRVLCADQEHVDVIALSRDRRRLDDVGEIHIAAFFLDPIAYLR